MHYLCVFLIALVLEDLGLKQQQGFHSQIHSGDATYCGTLGILHCVLAS